MQYSVGCACALLWGMLNTVEGMQFGRGCSVLWSMCIFSIVEHVHIQYCGACAYSVLWCMCIFSTVEDVHYGGGCLVLWKRAH